METLYLSEANRGECAACAADILRAGGVILYPTDTLYGLGADALSDKAVATVRIIKGREEGKPIHCIVADIAMAEKYAEFNEAARRLAEEFLPGPLTLVVEKKGGIESGIARGIETIGIRIPKNDFCLALAREFGRPYTTTSANVSGLKSLFTIETIVDQLDESAEHIDLAIDAGGLPPSAPSTVVGLSGQDVVILREGAITASEIFDVVGPVPRRAR